MTLSAFSVIGILLVVLEIYFPKHADTLQKFIIDLPSYIMAFFYTIVFYKGKSRLWFFKLLGLIVVVISVLVALYGSREHMEIALDVMVIGMWIPASFGVVMVWGPVASWIFKIFDYITRKKALAGIGIILTVMDNIF